jgi:putative transposase
VFYGQFSNQVRGHYFWLRRQPAKKGLQKVIKKIGDDESRITVDTIHKITRDLVDRAVETNSLLVVGNLKGLSKKTKKDRRNFNRKLTSFQYYRFIQYLTYKGAGVKVIKVFERLTSQICYRCVERGERKKCTGLFICHKCVRENADRNAAFNIAYRALGYISKVGVTVNLPITLTNVVPQEKLQKRLLIYYK